MNSTAKKLSSKQQILRGAPLAISVPFIAFYIGSLFDRHEDNRMSKFRDKSALFGKEKKPGEPPSWP